MLLALSHKSAAATSNLMSHANSLKEAHPQLEVYYVFAYQTCEFLSCVATQLAHMLLGNVNDGGKALTQVAGMAKTASDNIDKLGAKKYSKKRRSRHK